MTPDEIKSIIQKKVIGKIAPAHDDRGHHYAFVGDKSGRVVDSVTTKLILDKPHLVKWAVRIAFEWMESKWASMTKGNRELYLKGAQESPYDVRDEAGLTGHIAHDAIENYVKDWIATGIRPVDIKPYVRPKEGALLDYRAMAAARSGEQAIIKTGCIPIATEILVGSKRYNCAGTLDLLMWNPVTETLVLYDHKTSNAVNDTYAMQVAAYKKFFELMTGLKISECKILHLSKESDKYAVYKIPDIDDAWKAFLNISKIYDWQKNGRPKLEKDIKVITI